MRGPMTMRFQPMERCLQPIAGIVSQEAALRIKHILRHRRTTAVSYTHLDVYKRQQLMQEA